MYKIIPKHTGTVEHVKYIYFLNTKSEMIDNRGGPIIKTSVPDLQPPVPDPPAPRHVAGGASSVLWNVDGVRGRDTAQEETSILYRLIMGHQRTVLTLQTEHTLGYLPKMSTDTSARECSESNFELLCIRSFVFLPDH